MFLVYLARLLLEYFVFSCSMNALDALYSKDTKKNDIAERRKKLSELLLNEQKEFEVGLRNNVKLVFSEIYTVE